VPRLGNYTNADDIISPEADLCRIPFDHRSVPCAVPRWVCAGGVWHGLPAELDELLPVLIRDRLNYHYFYFVSINRFSFISCNAQIITFGTDAIVISHDYGHNKTDCLI